VKTVVVTGSECTGKTTLARDLARAYGTVACPEYARLYLEAKGPPLTVRDVEPIARGQMALEDDALAGPRRLLVKDTDLISTVVYSRYYYGGCPAWIEDSARERKGDLYLLLHPDVPWVADGPHRDRPQAREEIHGLFRETLGEFGLPFVDIEGGFSERRARAAAAVDQLLHGAGSED
jgi:NadR type nicotinamide-nucleotide adenylyltransferase